MMLPGNGALVSGSVTMRARPKNGFAGLEQLAQVAVAHGRGRHGIGVGAVVAPAGPLFGVEEEQLAAIRVELAAG